jgi:hypothetical protein
MQKRRGSNDRAAVLPRRTMYLREIAEYKERPLTHRRGLLTAPHLETFHGRLELRLI